MTIADNKYIFCSVYTLKLLREFMKFYTIDQALIELSFNSLCRSTVQNEGDRLSHHEAIRGLSNAMKDHHLAESKKKLAELESKNASENKPEKKSAA